MMQTIPGRFSWECVTPEIASQYLMKMPRNRPLRKSKVRVISKTFAVDGYRANHQAIAFDASGNLVDGQHRLHAVILVGVPVYMWVYYSVEELPTLHIDAGMPRTDSDGLYMDGDDAATRNAVAVLKRLVAGIKSSGGDNRLSRDELKEAMAKHSEAIRWAMERFATRKKGVTHASVIATVGRAYYTADRERLNEFCEVIKSGMSSEDADSGAIRLRDFLLVSPLLGGGEDCRMRVLKKTETALAAFLQKRAIKKLYETETELFPVPEFKVK